jgi:hypothetical protein
VNFEQIRLPSAAEVRDGDRAGLNFTLSMAYRIREVEAQRPAEGKTLARGVRQTFVCGHLRVFRILRTRLRQADGSQTCTGDS